MSKRRFLVVFFFAVGLLGCGSLTMAANTNNSIVDDGEMELTPEYNVQHIQGKDYSDVYAAFNFVPQNKPVRLRPGDTISVNGRVLEGIDDRKGYYYQGRIPVTKGDFVFTLSRAPERTMTHSFELPVLGIKELPKVYRPYETVRVPVQYIEPPKYASRDNYDLSIFGPVLRFDLVSTTRRKDNRYEFDRLPDIRDGVIVFRHIVKRAPPPNFYPAEIFRQQHIILSEMSDASRTGWATLSNTVPFTIEVREATAPANK